MLDIRGKARNTSCPCLSRIIGLAPSSLPVIFSRMVVFPAFRRPMINTRNRSHARRMSSDEMSMLLRSRKQRNRSDDDPAMEVVHPEDVYEIESEVQRSTFGWYQQTLSFWPKIILYTISTTTYMRTREPMQGLNGVQSKPFKRLVASALPGLLWR